MRARRLMLAVAAALAACGAAEPDAARAPGAVCGDARLRGAALAPVQGAGGCGIARPVSLTDVAGVALTRPVTLSCATAAALADWIEGAAQPAARRVAKADIAALTPFAGYACRPRNSRPGAKLSEHGRGGAIDIGAVALSDGRTLSVEADWKGEAGAALRALHASACGPFGTVLGPDSDPWHRDHIHLDTARRRGGAYCR